MWPLLRILITKILKTFLKDEEIKGLFKNKSFLNQLKNQGKEILKAPQRLKQIVLDVTGINKVKKTVESEIKKKVEKVVPEEVLELRKKVKDYYNQLRYWKAKAQNLGNLKKTLKDAFKIIDQQKKEIEELKKEIEELKKRGIKHPPPKIDFKEIGLKLNEELYDYYTSQGILYRFRQGYEYVEANYHQIRNLTEHLNLNIWVENFKKELEERLTDLCVG